MKHILLLLLLAALPCLGDCASDEICAQASDAGFNGGTLYSADSSSPQVRMASAFSFTRSLPSGLYVVSFYFAEPNVTGPGLRLFDVRINDAATYQKFDVYALSGGVGRVIRRSNIVAVTDGVLRIDFVTVSSRPAVVSAIRITPLGIGLSE